MKHPSRTIIQQTKTINSIANTFDCTILLGDHLAESDVVLFHPSTLVVESHRSSHIGMMDLNYLT